jgi:hypothetical protein
VHTKLFELHLDVDDDSSDKPVPASNLQRLAMLSQNQIPSSSEHALFKVSRYKDNIGDVWTWVGYYKGAAFAGENRGGHYVGIGIAFAERLASEAIAEVLISLLERFINETSSGGVVSESVSVWSFKQKDLDKITAIRFAALPEKFSGLQPEAATAIFRYTKDWSARELGKLIVGQLAEGHTTTASTIYLANWQSPQEKGEFYDAATLDSTIAVVSTGIRRSATASTFRGLPLDGQPPDRKRLAGNLSDGSEQRILDLERRLEKLEKSADRSGERLPLLLWLLVTLVAFTLTLQILGIVLMRHS